MSKHTPGPWQIDWYICREKGKELWRVPRSIGPACVDHDHWAGNHITVDAADAHLIAAAPDLLEALKAGPSIEHTLPTGLCTCSQCQFVRMRNAAIAKAEGQ